jgi:signal transduction histidine kinase
MRSVPEVNWPTRREWLFTIGLGAFQIAGSFGAAHNQPERHDIDALAVVLLVAGPVALAWRHRQPTIATVIAIAAVEFYIARGYAYGPIFASVALAFFHLAMHRPRRVSITLAAIAFGGYALATALDIGDHGGPQPGELALVAGWLTAIVLVSELAAVRRAQIVQRRQADELARERELIEQRLRLAQELHDVLAHNISLINVQASVALHLVATHPERAEPALATIKQASHDALRELRVALDVLRRGGAAPRSPAPTLDDVVALVDHVRDAGIDARLSVEGEPAEVPAATALAGYRIVQEALTNVVRHAHASTVDVRLAYGGGVTIDVVDNGVGTGDTPGNGITGMHERAAAVGGSVEVRSKPGRGLSIHAELPGRTP